MRDVIVIGGGLSGLAAAHELERRGVPYTLIEVKARLGGSIISRAEAGFVLDGGALAFPASDDWSWLPDFGLAGELFTLPGGSQVAFQAGTQVVIDALARSLTGDIMLRMAVSSLGQHGDNFAVCLENGLLLTARAVIVAIPARYAEHIFRTLEPEISLRLLDYAYDTITRVSLGYRRADIGSPGRRIWDMALPIYQEIEHPGRVPPDGVLLHLGARYPLPRTTPDTLVATLQTELGWPTAPLVSWVTYWPEADPIPPHLPDFAGDMTALMRLLPDGVALAGSDYNGLSLGARIAAGRAAAQQIAIRLGK